MASVIRRSSVSSAFICSNAVCRAALASCCSVTSIAVPTNSMTSPEALTTGCPTTWIYFFHLRDLHGPTACVGQFLRFSQITLTPPELAFCFLALGDIHNGPDKL